MPQTGKRSPNKKAKTSLTQVKGVNQNPPRRNSGKKPPMPKQKLVKNPRVYKQYTQEFIDLNNYSKAVEQELLNTLVPERAAQGPSIGSGLSGATKISTQIDLQHNSGNDGALFFTNNPRVPLLQLLQHGAEKFLTPDHTCGGPCQQDILQSLGSDIYYDSEVIVPVAVENSNQFKIRQSTGWVDKCLVVKCDLKEVRFDFQNPNGATIQYSLQIWKRTAETGPFNLDAQTTVSVAGGANSVTTLAATNPALANWVFVLTTIGTGVGALIDTYYINTYPTINPSYAWQPVHFLGSIAGTEVTNSWYQTCTEVRVLLASFLLSNYSAELYKNGQLSICKVLKGQLRKLTPEPKSLVAWMAKNPEINKRTMLHLNKGGYSPYLPTEWDDYEFHEPITQLTPALVDTSRAQGFLFAWTANDSADMAPELKSRISMIIEGKSDEQIVPMRPIPHSLELWNAWTQFLSNKITISENPSHISNMWKSVKAFMKDEGNQQIIKKVGKGLFEAAVAAAPLLLL